MSTWSQVLSIGAAALLIGGGVGAGTYAAIDEPDPAHYAIATTAEAPRLQLTNPDGLLTPADQAQLEQNLQRIDHPEVVRTIHILAFNNAENTRENINDTIEEYFRAHYPDEILDKHGFRDGTLILAVDMAHRHHAIYAADDVADVLDLHSESSRVSSVIDAMVPGLQSNNVPAALFAGASLAMDTAGLQEERYDAAVNDRTWGGIGAGMGAGALAGVVGGTGVALRNRRRRLIEQARADYSLVTKEYADLAGRLDGIDVRANSLNSAFADAELRRQWGDVRDRFLQLHDTVSGAGGISSIPISDDAAAYRARKQLADAAETLTHTSHAEDNINRLFNIEQGDTTTRRTDLARLSRDITKARTSINDATLRQELVSLEERVRQLDADPASPTFLDDYLHLLSDYRIILDAVKDKEFSDVKDRHKLTTPAIYDKDYWYPTYIPFVAMQSWHNTNVAAANSAASSSSSGVNTTFSSGFTAAGGSGSF
ncbi:DUF5129 domain-containing protein [Corynebacterium sp. CCUG 18816]|uniref:DUF5129 domain-containing protein n=1 Tax=Corynebacterium pseudogenitalium TaxID=38303 RepID=UPI00210BA30D|nr:DUF5129 domain-containing protein [Corynebacterium pseudogenitalium]MCQ4617362.1 DUF5129 domain-containing protein [Corynebacterium pseudogenitalium]